MSMIHIPTHDTAYDIENSREWGKWVNRVVENCLRLWGKEKPPLLIKIKGTVYT
jgi:hypothetical protein